MKKIFRTNLQLGLFIAALVITVVAAVLSATNSAISRDWINKDYDDYLKDPSSYTVSEVTIDGFKTLNGSNYKPLTYIDFYRVCEVNVTFAGGQSMKFCVSRDAGDRIGDKIKVAYDKSWDTDYDRKMKSSDIDPDTPFVIARAESVTDSVYSRTFAIIAVVSGVFAAVVFFICYKKKDAYEL
jgi:hypothetical protein